MWSLIMPNASGKKKQKETQPQYLTRLKSVHNLPIKFHFIRQFQPSNGWPSPAIMVSVGALDFIRINRISSNSKTETLDWVCTVLKVWKSMGSWIFRFQTGNSLENQRPWIRSPVTLPEIFRFSVLMSVLSLFQQVCWEWFTWCIYPVRISLFVS